MSCMHIYIISNCSDSETCQTWFLQVFTFQTLDWIEISHGNCPTVKMNTLLNHEIITAWSNYIYKKRFFFCKFKYLFKICQLDFLTQIVRKWPTAQCLFHLSMKNCIMQVLFAAKILLLNSILNIILKMRKTLIHHISYLNLHIGWPNL